jgi:hypothetical protein
MLKVRPTKQQEQQEIQTSEKQALPPPTKVWKAISDLELFLEGERASWSDIQLLKEENAKLKKQLKMK